MGHFETEILTARKNLKALINLSRDGTASP
jgi:hypothetical protein